MSNDLGHIPIASEKGPEDRLAARECSFRPNVSNDFASVSAPVSTSDAARETKQFTYLNGHANLLSPGTLHHGDNLAVMKEAFITRRVVRCEYLQENQ